MPLQHLQRVEMASFMNPGAFVSSAVHVPMNCVVFFVFFFSADDEEITFLEH